jgi:hypothetical protein
MLQLDGRNARLRLESVGAWDGNGARPELELEFERRLA